MTTLREKAIEAYQVSTLIEKDAERDKALIDELGRFFHAVGVSVVVDRNPLKLGELVFFASALEDSDGLFGYELVAVRQCDTCKEYLDIPISQSRLDDQYEAISLEELGQWLSRPHICEFLRKPPKAPPGFVK